VTATRRKRSTARRDPRSTVTSITRKRAASIEKENGLLWSKIKINVMFVKDVTLKLGKVVTVFT